ncbi:MAG: alpha-2-macroglobulin family protein, partial [Pseudomonadales bacterium]|nr:alpha-2-macroglobulin family protein [Pseudomonadales bacterium]
LGKNGITLYSRTTSSDGHIQFPSTRDFNNEKQPTVYVVKAQNDISFIPFDRQSRQINLSKFDIGGISSRYDQGNNLNAFLFSDRGIYRPSETVNIGFIVKNKNLSNVENIPLEVVIRGPRDNEVYVKRQNLLTNGFFDIQYPTDATSDTGKYNISLHLVRGYDATGRNKRYRGKEIGSASFEVEEFQPDTMKIDSKLENVANKGWYNNNSITAKIRLKNLFGIPAQDRKVSGRIIITPTNFSFKDYASYTFSSPFSRNQKALRTDMPLALQKTDADGLANFEIDLQRYREGTYNLRFISEGFDQAGGRSVIAANSALISPLDTLVGYKADGTLNYINANSKRAVEFIVIDKALKQIEKNALTVKLIEIQPISTLIKQRNGTYKYQTVKREKELSRSAFDIPETGHQYAIDTTSPGDYALEIMDENNRRVSRIEYSVVGYGNIAGKLDKSAELQLKLDKTDYLAGELIEMNIKAPYSGAGLITIETNKVHHFKWFSTNSDSTLQSIRIPSTLEGTAYVSVAFVRDIGSKEIFSSPLSYAVQPFSIDKSKRKIDVNLTIKDIVRPGKPMKVTYTTSRKSKIALFAVDEGILQVAKYKTPDPLEHFLQKRALGVETLQILDLILPGFDLVRELSASGGGEQSKKIVGKNLNPFARKTDKPAVFWSGIHEAGPESRTVTFDVPDSFAGELRVMAVAVGKESIGTAHDSTIVRGPFVLSPNVLTQAAPGDEFLVTLGVANIVKGSGKGAKVTITVESSKHLTILGDSESAPQTTLAIDEGAEGQLTFKVKVNQLLGPAKLHFTARHKNESSNRTASLSVRPAMPYYTSMNSGFEKSGKVEQTLVRNLYGNLAKQSLAASASPLVLVDGLTSYLKSFPHGCTEQVVSKVFPLIGLASHPAFGPHQSKVHTHFSHLITKLRERQLGDGGFSFWPGQHTSAAYPSIYAMHFLIEARDTGFPVPTEMMQRGKAYLTDYAGRTSNNLNEARNRANAIYLLTRLGVVTTNYLIDLQKGLEKDHKKEWRKDLLASYMAATYALLQKEDDANRLIPGYKIGSETQQQYDDFHSYLTQDAQHLYLLSKHFEHLARSLPEDNVLALTKRIFNGEYNTIASAYSILALGAYSKLVLEKPLDENIVFAAQLRGKNIDLKAAATPFLTANYKTDVDAVSVQSQTPLFFLNVQSGFDKNLPQQPVRNNIEIIREFVDENGAEIISFEQGKEITVRLKVRALGRKTLTNIAVIDLLPGGFEVVRSSVHRTAYNWRASYIDVREDRVVYYGDFDSSLKELSYKVKLTTAGRFLIPPSFAESMYDRSVRAVSKAGIFTVTKVQ